MVSVLLTKSRRSKNCRWKISKDWWIWMLYRLSAIVHWILKIRLPGEQLRIPISISRDVKLRINSMMPYRIWWLTIWIRSVRSPVVNIVRSITMELPMQKISSSLWDRLPRLSVRWSTMRMQTVRKWVWLQFTCIARSLLNILWKLFRLRLNGLQC